MTTSRPRRRAGVWPRSYLDAGPYEMYSREELAFQKKHAFATLIRNGITTALPIASLFYRAWGETAEEFEDAAEAAASLGLRTYLGPAYRTGNQAGRGGWPSRRPITTSHAASPELDAAADFAKRHEGAAGGLIRAMLAPDRIETSTAELLRRTAAVSRDLDIPVRLHCCQSKIEYALVLSQHGLGPPEWLQSLGFPERALPCCRTAPSSPAAARSIGPAATSRSSAMRGRPSSTARWSPAGTATPSTISAATAPWGSTSPWARIRARPTW